MGVFVVEDIECRQTNVGDFFLIESNCRVRRQSIAGRTNGCPGRAARQGQRPSDSQYRYGFRPTLSLRSSLAMRHGGGLLFTPAPSSISTARLVPYRFNKSGSLAMLAAIRRASSFASSLAAESPPRLILEIDVGQLLAVGVAHHEASVLFFDGPWWREAAWRRHASIISSALRISDCGKVRPSAFTVFWFSTNFNLVGCSTGRSAGFSPLRILST